MLTFFRASCKFHFVRSLERLDKKANFQIMSAILVKSFVGQAESYFDKELTNERENYYTEKGVKLGQWTGKGAELLGLTGDINKTDFSRLSRGINPQENKRFRRMTLGRTREVNGELKPVKEIAGWDMVISAPKSVSIVALIGEDDRVRDAHIEAVADTLHRAERQAQSNNGGGKREQTGNLIIGRFQHDSARPSSKSGFVAPQLHDHCYIMNATFRSDGVLKPLESLELHRAQKYLKNTYYTGLADRLQKLGYEIEIDKETGAPEIKGISKEYREACSPRRMEILELADKAGRNFRQLGLVSRREKIFDKSVIKDQHKEIEKVFGNQATRLVEAVRENRENQKNLDNQPSKINSEINSDQEAKHSKEAVTFALAKLSEREAVFNPRDVLNEAYKRALGNTSVAAIEKEFDSRKENGIIKSASLRDGRDVVFLTSDEKIEADLPRHIQTLKSHPSFAKEIEKAKVSYSENPDFQKLSDEQKSAVREILQSDSTVMTLEGRAGTGKTTTLSLIGKTAKIANYQVLGLAPTTSATQELNGAGIKSETLQKLLASKNPERDHRRFYIIDESSFISSRQMDRFFVEAVKGNDRVLFVGDTRQHEGVEAGKPFARMQRDGLATGAKIGKIQRQTKKSDRQTVQNLSEGKIYEAVEEMRRSGQITEIKDRANRHNAIVEAFTAEPEKSLIVAPRNKDREEINAKVHDSLKESGKIGDQETEIKILRPRNELTGVEREFAGAYRENDVIIYTRGSKENGIAAKDRARVIGTDREQNLLTVEIKTGDGVQEVTYNPKRLRGVSVWTEEKIKVSEGDRLQFRAPFETKSASVANGTMSAVEKLDGSTMTLATGQGKPVKFDLSEAHALDYGYAVTSHSSQGKTIDRVLIHAETTESKMLLNERMAYVAVSRARNEMQIFTDDAAQLSGKMARRTDKSEITQVKNENRIADRVLDQVRESLEKQSIEVSPKAWQMFEKDLIENFSQQKPSDNQLKLIDKWQSEKSLEKTNAGEISRLETIEKLLDIADYQQRDSIAKNTMEHYERQATEILKKEMEKTHEKDKTFNR
jgi:conjugative relaxase-like TrwC/TraI family protein